MSRRARYISALKPATSPAIWEGRPAASNFVMRRTPLTPRLRWSQNASIPIPRGDTTPRPVATTRLIRPPRRRRKSEGPVAPLPANERRCPGHVLSGVLDLQAAPELVAEGILV